MTDKNVREMTERAARYLAQKGFAAIEEHQAIVDLARQMLATGEVPPQPAKKIRIARCHTHGRSPRFKPGSAGPSGSSA